MSIAFSCACGRNLRAGPHLAGKKTKCPGCGAVLTIPAASEEAAPAPPPAARPKTAPAAAQVTAPAVASAVTCTCGKRIATKPEWAGKTIKCPACENRIKVPAAASPVVPAAAAAKQAPAKRPAPPPIDDDPFGDDGMGTDDEGAGSGGYQPFDDEGDEDTPPPPARKGKPAAPAKKGGSKVLFMAIVAVLLVALGGVGYVFLNPGVLNPAPPPPPSKPVATTTPDTDENDDAPDVVPNPKKGGPGPVAKTPAKETDEPDLPVDPKPKVTPKTTAPTTPDLPDVPVPPSDTPPQKKKETKKSTPTTPTPPVIDVPKFGPAPPSIRLDPEPENAKDPKAAPGKKTVFDYVPGDAVSFAALRVGAFLDSPSGAKIVQMAGPFYAGFVKETEEKMKLDPKDIRIILVIAMSVPSDPMKADQSGVLVAETTKPMDAAALEKLADSKAEVLGKTMYFKKNDPVGILLLSPTRIMNGSKEMITALLTGTPKTGPLSASLKEAAASKAIFFMAFQTTPELGKLREKGLESVGKSFPPAEAISDAVAGQFTISEDKSLKFSLKLKYADADHAEKSKKALEELVEQGSALLTLGKKKIEELPQGAKLTALGKSALASVKLSLEAETLTVPLEIDATIGELAEIGMSMAPMFMPGSPPKGPPPAPKQPLR